MHNNNNIQQLMMMMTNMELKFLMEIGMSERMKEWKNKKIKHSEKIWFWFIVSFIWL